MTDRRGPDPWRLAESAGAATVVLGLTASPVAWRMLDTSLTVVLGGMLVALTIGVYALHAVTFDCFRMTRYRGNRHFPYTRSED